MAERARVHLFANHWLKQQVQLCAKIGRDGGKGFRDQLQDAWAVAAFHPSLARSKILETLRYEYADGRRERGWLPVQHHVYSDGTVWIPIALNGYLKETGDASILHEVAPYLDGGSGTALGHALVALRNSFSGTGGHGLVHALEGDWNDSLNMIGREGRGESVWTSIALVLALREMAEIAAHVLGDAALAREMLEKARAMSDAVNAAAWDGRWYLAAYNDDGEKVGSRAESEGRVYLNSQTWAILAGVARGERLESCLRALDSLLDSPYGPLTLYPPYTKFNPSIGRLTSFVPGIWENGTPYCHGGTFKIVSDCACGRGDAAVHCLKEQCIYCYLDLITYRKFKSGDGVESAHLLGDSAKPYRPGAVSAQAALVPEGDGSVRSDTGELSRSWRDSFGTIDTPMTQCAYGMLNRQGEIRLKDLSIQAESDFAVIALSSSMRSP